eukprot:scaffold241039_cov30-Prasinocladus_malaysianus.AAC.1
MPLTKQACTIHTRRNSVTSNEKQEGSLLVALGRSKGSQLDTDGHEEVAGLQAVARDHGNVLHRAADGCADGGLHLHGAHHHKRRAGLDGLPRLGEDFDDLSAHGGPDAAEVQGVGLDFHVRDGCVGRGAVDNLYDARKAESFEEHLALAVWLELADRLKAPTIYQSNRTFFTSDIPSTDTCIRFYSSLHKCPPVCVSIYPSINQPINSIIQA